jgi:hypothetical protein
MKKLVVVALAAALLTLWGAPSAFAADHRCPPGATVVPPVVDGNVIVEPGAFCIGFGSQIKGNVIVLPNAIGFHLHGGNVIGNVQAENPQLDIRIFVATVHGSIQIKRTRAGTAGAVCRSEIFGDVILEENAGITTVGIGFPQDVCFAGNTIHGQVKLVKNVFSGIWNVQGNTILPAPTCAFVANPTLCGGIMGNLQVFDNVVTAGQLNVSANSVREDLQLFKNRGSTRVTGNTVGENLQCFDNTPPPFSAGNVARTRQGQCLL